MFGVVRKFRKLKTRMLETVIWTEIFFKCLINLHLL